LPQSLRENYLVLGAIIVMGVLLVILGFDQAFTFTTCPPAGVIGSCIRGYALDFAAILFGGLAILIPMIRVVRKSMGSSP
jgi:hypothetical protein